VQEKAVFSLQFSDRNSGIDANKSKKPKTKNKKTSQDNIVKKSLIICTIYCLSIKYYRIILQIG
jgi:hypothetical protein